MPQKYRYIKKPSWLGDEGPLYEHEGLNETLRVLFDQKTNDVKQISVWETTFPPGAGIPQRVKKATQVWQKEYYLSLEKDRE